MMKTNMMKMTTMIEDVGDHKDPETDDQNMLMTMIMIVEELMIEIAIEID
jgi:hypothetical protein